MTERDRGLLALRPDVPAATPDRAASAVEAFLHATLRPVLKLQNEVLLALVAAHVHGLAPDFARAAPDDRRDRLRALLRSDAALGRTLTGVVLGMLTADELAVALANAAEVRRRIAALVAERVASQSDAVAALAAAHAAARSA